MRRARATIAITCRASVGPRRPLKRTALGLILGLLAALLTVVSQAPPAGAATAVADWSSEPLLLIHGWTDNCETAFDTPSDPNGSDDTAETFLQTHGFSGVTKTIGYYTPDRGCTGNLNDVDTNGTNHQPAGSQGCNTLSTISGEPASDHGTKDDHIDRLGCLLAWYIYDTYTKPASGQVTPVNVLAHSMGGLIVRDAIGRTSAKAAGFPPAPLRVLRVVTVATPHGGIGGGYYVTAKFFTPAGAELDDMAPGSTFMNLMAAVQKPQGAGGTFWGLLGASDGAYGAPACAGGAGGATVRQGNVVSCTAANLMPQVTYPDSDGVAPSISQMAMSADVKVLYGVVSKSIAFVLQQSVADLNTQYEHEIQTQGVSGPLQAPFYLNDIASTATAAWFCKGSCNKTDYSDLPIGNGTAVSMPRSLTEIATLLTTPVIIDVPSGGAFETLTSQLGGSTSTGVPGLPLERWQALSAGEEQDFTRANLYWSTATGTHEVHGTILHDYGSLGAASSPLGFPTSNEQAAPGGAGTESLFAGTSCSLSGIAGSGGAIFWNRSTGVAAEMHGCLYQAYLHNYGGSTGILGYPTSNEGPMGGGRVNYLAGTGCGSSSGSALYFNGAVHAVRGCIFAKYRQIGEATSSLGFPIDDEFALGAGRAQDFQHGWINFQSGVATVNTGPRNIVVGHAAHAGNDYPYESVGQFEHQGEGIDAWREYYGQCDSFAAWKVYENLAGTPQLPNRPVPATGWTPSNAGISPVNQDTWLNADEWKQRWTALGYSADRVPTPGAIAFWGNTITDPRDPALGTDPTGLPGSDTGHVGYVTDVYPDGSITVEQYNMRVNGEYSVVHLNYNSGYTDTSFGQGAFNVPWPSAFIHIADGAAAGVASPAEPSPGVLGATYPSQVKVIGPGAPANEFFTTNLWYSRPAHGEIGKELYTHTNGPTAVSTATWTPSGLAPNTCYQVDALVPDNYSDNPTAIYTVVDSAGASYAAVNETVQTNDWSELGIFKTNGSGAGLSVKLDDRGDVGRYVAADAMRFWRQVNCAGQGDASPVMSPSSLFGSWSPRSGHGFFGAEQYSATTGSLTPSKNAMWTPQHLVPHGCYDLFLYVPDNYSDNPAASYWSNDANYGVFYPQLNETSYTNQFAEIGMFRAYPDGTLPLELFNSGLNGTYVAADAATFVLNPKCLPENGATHPFGNVNTSSIVGPGSLPSAFSTTGNWSYYLGHGYGNHQLYAADGSGAAATWTFQGPANACYRPQAYIPIQGYADNPNSAYTFDTEVGVLGTQINQNNSNGWTTFQGNPVIHTGADGKIIATMTNAGPSGYYTGADAISFNQIAC